MGQSKLTHLTSLFSYTGVVNRLLSVLESVISKLARYDEGSILGSILSFTVSYATFTLLTISKPSYLGLLLPTFALLIDET